MQCTETAGPGKARRVLLVDGHPLVCIGLAAVLRSESDLRLCGDADGVGEALELIRNESPDLVLTALSLRSGHGLELIRRVHILRRDMPVVVYSLHDEMLYAHRALKAGAVGYVGKWENIATLVLALHHVLEGGIWLSPGLKEQFFREVGREYDRPAPNTVYSLSDRELMIFEATGGGMTLQQIAEHLHLSVKTVETHRQNIRHKLGLQSSAEFARAALTWMLTDSGYSPHSEEDGGSPCENCVSEGLVGALPA